jgi:hypothetical protein
MFTLETSLTFSCPPDRVWQALVDTPQYKQWNPLIRQFAAPQGLAPGKPAHLSVRLWGVGLRFRVTLLEVRHTHRLAWRGGVHGLLTGEHEFLLYAEANGTRLVHREVFRGLLSRFIPRHVQVSLEQQYAMMDHALHRYLLPL